MATWCNTSILSHESWDRLFRHHIQLMHASSADNHSQFKNRYEKGSHGVIMKRVYRALLPQTAVSIYTLLWARGIKM